LRRMVWNPRWNETLFLVSCAERLLAEPTAHSEHEIFKRIARTLLQQPEPLPREQQLRFRIVLLYREGSELIEETAYESGMVAMTALQETVTTA
ncbi:MAG: hypothetical protein OEY07_10845, partial [Gammaproteobacteria bacterium]|nr:hypothetical protein [Gammaproteobacteria bacterium]